MNLKLKLFLILGTMLVLFSLQQAQAKDKPASHEVYLGIMLDTSNSMDGLIEQAKSQLWQIVNQLSALQCNGEEALLKIALYEYGNDNLPSQENYIRQVSGFTSDLDKISSLLFSLQTKGGNEFCGAVIGTSIQQLEWPEGNYLKAIYIAGNEPFTQGPVSYLSAIGNAREKGVLEHTIFCGDYQTGVNGKWKDGAEAGGGNYSCIQQDRVTTYISTPYDKDISSLNSRLNRTYIYYGNKGKEYKKRQDTEDMNARSYSESNVVMRTNAKISKNYVNNEWDLVDAVKNQKKEVKDINKEILPPAYQNMSDDELTNEITEKQKERDSITKEIKTLESKRQAFIATQKKDNAQANGLEESLLKGIIKQAQQIGFE